MPPSHQWIAGELDRFDEQRQRDRHMHGAGDGHVGIRPWSRVLEAVLLDVPDRCVGRNRQIAERHVTEQPVVRALDGLTAQHAREPAPTGRQ